MVNIRNMKVFKERLAQLEQEASRHGVVLVPAQAADLLADHIAAVAHQFGVTERTALQTYIAPHAISLMAERPSGNRVTTWREVAQR
ncbi:hypothetical protein [Micromonospora sp. NPDC048830]|uniref:hypothetical protein n=1 Tax=Micromonospora sp. NPDC048830 TaxID=3364257 RepID=UPI00371DDF08